MLNLGAGWQQGIRIVGSCVRVCFVPGLEGVEPPSGYGPLPRNSILLSREGLLNTAMAGGDIDGDDNEVAKQADLVAFLELTQPYVDAYNWEDPFVSCVNLSFVCSEFQRMQELSVTALTGLNPYETEWPTCAGADRCLLSDLD
ncbi:unnamed protein product, partial [Symbiodinium sp. CCMP2592]